MEKVTDHDDVVKQEAHRILIELLGKWNVRPEMIDDLTKRLRATAQLAAGGRVTALDDVYTERNKCVALIARMASLLKLKVGILIDSGEEDPEWQKVVVIDLPTGQVSWHVSEDVIQLYFAWLPQYGEGEWDGHTSEEKYERVIDAAVDASRWPAPALPTKKEKK